jgi:hypothetical protein
MNVTDVINPQLYRLLTQKFGEVKIANQGCHAYFQRMPDPLNPRRTITHATDWGEYYCVNCPFCRDTRARLWINHTYASEVVEGRRQNTYLAVCYNEQCLRVPGRTEQLEQIIFGHGAHLRPQALPLAPVTTPHEPEPVRPPGTVIPLTELAEDHPAREYVRSRGFCAETLTENFNVGLCISVEEPRLYTARGRLYIPITYRNELVGWQCRAISPKLDPKYFNAPGMRKSSLLYNYDVAQSQPYVIVVEGVPSVWRLGKAAVCLFGKTMSYQQQKLIARTWAGKPVFLLLDHDAKSELDKATTTLSNMSVNVVPVAMPDERDPADYSPADINDLLLERASAAGVEETIQI